MDDRRGPHRAVDLALSLELSGRPTVRLAFGEDHEMAGARVLFTCRPLAGHYEPLVPLASSAKGAGYLVAFATGEPYDERARRAGFEAFRVGPPERFRDEWAPRFPGFDRLVGDEQRRFFLTEIFANLELEPRAAGLEAVIDAWAPHVVCTRSPSWPRH